MELESLLGVPLKPATLNARKLKIEEKETYILDTLAIDLNGEMPVSGYLARPKHTTGQKLPVVLVNHSHGGNYRLGKKEMIQGADYLQDQSYASAITGMGYACISIDMPLFGERQGMKESELVKQDLLEGKVLWGQMIFENQRLLDYIEMCEEFDSTRIATIGMSMGGLQSWWLSAIDPRIKLTIDIAAQLDLETLIQCRGLDHHGFYYYVPRLLQYFSTTEIQKKIVPRKRLSLVGRFDNMCPHEGVEKLDSALKDAYSQAGVPENWQSVVVGSGHQETAEMRREWVQFLEKNL